MNSDEAASGETDELPAPSPNPAFSQQTGRRRWQFRLAAVVLVLLLFGLLEAGLRIADVAAPDEHSDPYVGFRAVHPLFELEADGQTMRTSKPRRVFFGIDEFPKDKQPAADGQRVFRAFVLGGSTVRGRPYDLSTSFARWLELEIEGRSDNVDAQVVNCGGLSYASYRLRPILDEVLQYDPDLIVIATGHNEFLEDRTYHQLKDRSETRAWLEEQAYSLRIVKLIRQLGEDFRRDSADVGGEGNNSNRQILPAEVDARLDDLSGYASYHRDDAWREQVAVHFRESLLSMIASCRDQQVPVVLVQLGGNLRDTPPFKSELSADLTPEEDQLWQTEFQLATKLERDRPKAALEHYRRCEQIDGRHALLLFRIARCHDWLEQYEKARDYYLRARDEDICPLRKSSALTKTLDELAAETGVPLVPAQTEIMSRSPQGIPGFDAYVDHVHPTLGSHQLIGQLVADALSQHEILELASDWPDRRQTYSRHFGSLGPAYLPNGNRRIGWLEGWARRHKLFEETIPHDARSFLHRGHRELDLGQRDSAMQAYAAVAQPEQSVVPELLEHARRLVWQGRAEDAEYLLSAAIGFQPSATQRNEVWLGLLVSYLEQQDDAAATELLKIRREELQASVAAGSPWLELMESRLPNELQP